MKIRIATNDDQAGIEKVVFSTLKEYGLEPDPGGTDGDLRNVEENYIANGGYFAVVEELNRIIASVGIFMLDHKVCELRKMYILQSHRGRGLGKKLLNFAIEKAKELGFEQVVLETASPLKEAILLYKKFGFTEFTPYHMSPRCDQAFQLKL